MPTKRIQIHIKKHQKPTKQRAWYFLIRSSNGRILAIGHGYNERSSAFKGVNSIINADKYVFHSEDSKTIARSFKND